MPIDVILTDRIRDAIEEVFRLETTPKQLRNELGKWRRSGDVSNKGDSKGNIEDVLDGNDTKIPFRTVKEVFETLKRAGKAIYLNVLLQGSGLYFEPTHEPKKSPELVARLEKLQAKQDQLRYRAMVKNIDKELLYKDKKALAFEVRSTSRQLSSVVNFVLSVGGTFVFGYMSSQYAFTYIGLRVVFGLILASIVALAELYFMAKGAEI